MQIKATVIKDELKPLRAYPDDGGSDLRSAINVTVYPGEVVPVPTGLRVAIPSGYVGILASRSGHGKLKVTLANSIGVIDSKYRGEVVALLENEGNEPLHLEFGDRVAQLLILPSWVGDFDFVEELDETERGEAGFGSTGTK